MVARGDSRIPETRMKEWKQYSRYVFDEGKTSLRYQAQKSRFLHNTSHPRRIYASSDQSCLAELAPQCQKQSVGAETAGGSDNTIAFVLIRLL